MELIFALWFAVFPLVRESRSSGDMVNSPARDATQVIGIGTDGVVRLGDEGILR